jgi:hypothetical protein
MNPQNKNIDKYPYSLKNAFLNSESFSKGYLKDFNTVFDHLSQIQQPIYEWTNANFDDYLNDIHSGSENTINKNISMIKKIYIFSRNFYNLKPIEIKPTKESLDYIDRDIFFKSILSVFNYDLIRLQLTKYYRNLEYNFRDKLIFELAWLGMTSQEIKEFKYDQLNFYNSEIYIATKRSNYYIGRNILQDIEHTIKAEKYLLKRDYSYYEVDFKPSEYVIRSTISGKKTDNLKVANPSDMLKNSLQEVECPGIYLEWISLEAIRKSGIMYSFATGRTMNEVKKMYNIKLNSELKWLKKLSDEIYFDNPLKSIPIEGNDSEGDFSAKEGDIKLHFHKRRERNSKLAKLRKEKEKREKGVLECCACGFDFSAIYGIYGTDYIECHHIVALSDLSSTTQTRLSDLELVCSNCHSMIHKKTPFIAIADIKQMINKKYIEFIGNVNN